MGTLNNCGNGHTPWGTYLACEENWNGYFGTADGAWTPTPEQARYGVSAAGFAYSWHVADPRFDVALNPNELHRFGWVVEIDPMDPHSKPLKRTALGRVKHESAAVTESRGRVVVYTGDDENLEYVYKFVGDKPWRQPRARGKSPLDEGTLYVAKFDEDGTGTWLPLVHGQGALTVANGFADQADVLLRTRQAGDAVGATPLHRPEWVAVDEHTKDVYLTLTNGSAYSKTRQDPARPTRWSTASATPTPTVTSCRWRETDGDNTALSFEWDIFTLAGDPEYDQLVQGLTGDNIFGSPDGIWVDDDGRVWIQTDISNSSQNLATRGLRQHRQQPDARRTPGDPGDQEVPRRSTWLRGHRCHHDARPADHVRQHPAPRRVHHVLEHPVRRTHDQQPAHREQLARLRPAGPTPIGHRGDPPQERRRHRIVTLGQPRPECMVHRQPRRRRIVPAT